MKQTLISIAMRLLLLGLALYLGVLVLMYFYQRNLQYFPNSKTYPPSELGLLRVEEVKLDTPDGEKILAWYRPAESGRPTILYFHGNGGGLSNRAEKIRSFTMRNFGVMAVSYRGYEGSTGSPSEQGFIIDANTAYDWLASRNVKPADIYVLGESIGTGVAVQLAAAKPVGAVALESPYLNAVDIGAAAYPWMPVRLLMKDQFRSSQYIGSVKAPLLVSHGVDDTLIPFEQGEALFQMANKPKQMNKVEGAGHDISQDAKIWAREAAFFEDVKSGKLAAN
jgi:uncharacterized protein